MKKAISILIISLVFALTGFAQGAEVEMADHLRADGKIYVVVGVIGILFLGMLGYLITLDMKISKVEKNQGSGKSI